MTWTPHKSWQPIESAPKDGSRVQLLIPYSRDKFSEAQCTDHGFWEPLTEEERNGPMKCCIPQWGLDDGGCWRFDGDDGGFDIQPTHWRPGQSE